MIKFGKRQMAKFEAQPLWVDFLGLFGWSTFGWMIININQPRLIDQVCAILCILICASQIILYGIAAIKKLREKAFHR